MPSSESDFLDAIERSFSDRTDFINYIDESYCQSNLRGEFNIIGAINNLEGGQVSFANQLDRRFEILDETGDLQLLYTSVDDEYICIP